MLIITRRVGGRIVIGKEVSIMVVDVRGSQVRLGVDAPRAIEVYREEIYRRMHTPAEPEEATDPAGAQGSAPESSPMLK